MLRGCTVPAPRHPSPKWSQSCAQGSARAAPEQYCAPRSAGDGSAPSQGPLAPARAPSESVCLSCTPSAFPTSSPSSLLFLPGCRAQPRIPPFPQLESVSLAAATGEAAAAREASPLPPRFSGWSRRPAWLPPRPFPAAPGGRPTPSPHAPTPARFSPKWAGRLAGDRRPCTAITG